MQVLKHFNLTSSKLAEIIGIQRSGLSHILSGRNNPSYDFIVKLLENFPMINANWLLIGHGNMLLEDRSDIDNLENDRTGEARNIQQDTLFSNMEAPVNKNIPSQKDAGGYKSKQLDDSDDSLEKVILLFRDGTFRSYSG